MMKVPWLSPRSPTNALVELVDIYPTLTELCRLPAPDYLEGVSLVPLLTGAACSLKTAAFSTIGKNARSIRTDRYRLIVHPQGELELYDYNTDPNEDQNLAQEAGHQKLVAELRAALEAGGQGALNRR